MINTLGISVLIVIGIVAMCYTTIYNTQKMDSQFKIQIEAAKTARNSHIINMPYKDLIEVVNTLITYFVSDKVLSLGLQDKSDEELSIIFDDILLEICVKVKMSLSKDIIQGIKFYVTEDYLDIYIKDTCRLALVARNVIAKR